MQKEITLTVNDNLVIKDYSGQYTRQDLSKSVAYWLNKINQISDQRPLAICFGAGSTTFQTVAVLLAIISSGRNYYKFDQLAPGATKETIKYPNIEGGVSATFIAGTIKTDFDYSNDSDIYEVESVENKKQSISYDEEHPLIIDFRLSQKRYNNTSGTTTGYPKLIEACVGNDGFSIKAAMDYYINENDHCVFSHNMSHIGVHTTAILPSIFKAKQVSFINVGANWTQDVSVGTHTQYFYTMLEHYKLPKVHNLKTVTTGGDFLMPNLVKELLNSGIEKIIDIYGLTEAAPPLAIREITSLDDLDKPFIWINNAYTCYLDERNTAVVVRPDGVHWHSNDLAKYDSVKKEFYYLGRFAAGLRIRMNGVLVESVDFREQFEKETNISDYFLDMNHNIPKILLKKHNEVIAKQFLNKTESTVELCIVDELLTNGGIKNTR